MQALRESLTSGSSNVSEVLQDSSVINTGGVSSPSSVSGDELSEKSHAIPSSLIKEHWQLILAEDAPINDIQSAIDRCKELVTNCDECTTERKWLVRHLVELRFRLRELQDVIEDPCANGPTSKVVLGHHFVNRPIRNLPTSKQYCDHCSGIIWSVVQASYICSDCSYCVHHKCLYDVLRICAHILTSECTSPLEDICPEIGLSEQRYKCAECPTLLNFTIPKRYICFGKQYRAEGTMIESRLCDYSGLYYCPTCHWNDTAIIPARIIHNWDFSPRKVGRSSLQQLLLLYDRPVFNLEERNPKLFVFIQMLSLVKKIRENLYLMRKYLCECRFAISEKILEQNNITSKRHWIEKPDMYSITDLVNVENGTIKESLNNIFDLFDKHIRNCEICSGKGYLCEICSNDEIIYPFDDGAINCKICNSVYHRVCWLRKNTSCTKCKRIEQRKTINETDSNNITAN